MANIIDSYSESNENNLITVGSSGSYTDIGQSFTGNGATLGSVQFYISRFGGATHNAFAYIYAHSGTFGTSSIPTGAALATSDAVAIISIPTSATLITFNFSGGNQITLTNGTNYCVVFENTSADAPQLGRDTSSPTHGGNLFNFPSSVWTAIASQDLCFYIYDNASTDLNVIVTPGIQEIGGVRIV